MRQIFQEMVRSLEGKVYESTASPSSLFDVRRREGGRWVFNPELLTLITEIRQEPAFTPGSEPLTLPDLVAMDPQITFDKVARRVTRLKVFRVLAAVRELRAQRQLDPDEPIFKDPNALLRRLVRGGTLSDDALLDPWGGTIEFVRTGGAPIPFLSTIRGWELRAPGPDGAIGTADDVRDPFERVLRSGTPYAIAVDEDRIADARWDFVVSESSVQSWKETLEELTGTHMVEAPSVRQGSTSHGEGYGYGSGHGVATVGHGRGSAGIASGDAFWSPPVRTDADGRARFTIPLGDAETTWSAAFVGVPDGHGPATSTMSIASDLPLSVRVASGARWVVGDRVDAEVTVRNRTNAPMRVTVTAAAEGAASLDDPRAATQIIDVPSRGAESLRVPARAARAGEARLVVTARAPSAPEDTLRHAVEIVPAAERRALTTSAWLDAPATRLGVELDHYVVTGSPVLVLERGVEAALSAALAGLEPDDQTSTRALVDALDAATRIERWATARGTARGRALAEAAKAVASRARGRASAYAALDEPRFRASHPHGEWTLRARLRALSKEDTARRDEEHCPPSDEPALEVEPAPDPEEPPCWGAFVADAGRALAVDTDPERLAAAILALADRPHRAAMTSSIADRLRAVVKLRADGELASKDDRLRDRPARALIYAALLRAQRLGASPASAGALFGKLVVLRDATGGYGSSAATLGAVRALLASQLEGHGTSRVRVRSGPLDRAVDVPASGSAAIPFPDGALDARVDLEGPGLLARLERPALRSWSRPPPAQSSPVSLDVVWPSDARAGSVALLRVSVQQKGDGIGEVDARVPLPPGVVLAVETAGVAQLQGVLSVRRPAGRTRAVVEIPVRFGLAGRFSVPEATARLARAPSPAAVAPARAVVVR